MRDFAPIDAKVLDMASIWGFSRKGQQKKDSAPPLTADDIPGEPINDFGVDDQTEAETSSDTVKETDTKADTPENAEANAQAADAANGAFKSMFSSGVFGGGPLFSLAEDSSTNGVFSVSLQQAISTGDWKDSDISELDEIINGIENGTINYKRFPPEASGGWHKGGRIHEAASVILAGKGGSDQAQPLSVSERYERDTRQQPVQERIIESWARAQGVWYDNLNDAVKELETLYSFRATCDNHVLLGFREGDVLHVIFIESQFGDIYNHGTK